MSIDIGRFGIWKRAAEVTPDLARTVEELGYGALWVGGSPPGDLAVVEAVIDATSSIGVATGIVNMWREDAGTVAGSYHRIQGNHPNRFLLGVGIGHPESTSEYRRPYETMVGYMEQLDSAGVPSEHMILAALGPKALRLAAERTAGSHPYFTTPKHTRMARDIAGPNVLLAPEQTVVVDDDRDRARETARSFAARYLGLVNYRNSLLREGWSESELDDGGSDKLLDEVVLVGSLDEIAAGISAHIEAGADHVCIQDLGPDPEAGYRDLAPLIH
jgi:probable F420-dependent oxidoreductase